MAASEWMTMGTSLIFSPWLLQMLMTVKAVMILVSDAICRGWWQFSLCSTSLLSASSAQKDWADTVGLSWEMGFLAPSGSSQFCQYRLLRSGLRLHLSSLPRPRTGLVLVYTVLLWMDRCFFSDRYCRLPDHVFETVDRLVKLESTDSRLSDCSSKEQLLLFMQILLLTYIPLFPFYCHITSFKTILSPQ